MLRGILTDASILPDEDPDTFPLSLTSAPWAFSSYHRARRRQYKQGSRGDHSPLVKLKCIPGCYRRVVLIPVIYSVRDVSMIVHRLVRVVLMFHFIACAISQLATVGYWLALASSSSHILHRRYMSSTTNSSSLGSYSDSSESPPPRDCRRRWPSFGRPFFSLIFSTCLLVLSSRLTL